jgi:thioredoxin 1
MSIKHLTDETFDKEISNGVVLVDFWADWCNPCKVLAPVIDELAAEYGDRVNFTKVDVDEHREIAARNGVKGIPTVAIFRDGTELKRFVGVNPKAVYKDALAAL